MCLRAEGIDENDGGVRRVRRAEGLSGDNRGVVRGREIRDASKGSEKTTEAEGARRRARGIYDGDGGIGGEI